MSRRQQILKRVIDDKVVAVIRGNDPTRLIDIGEALVEGGVGLLEVTFTVPGAANAIASMVEHFGDRAVIGGGSILDPETAKQAISAGAAFVVGPNTNIDVIQLCRRYATPVFAGAYTPTEIVTAWQAGADIVKLFPADIGGPAYLKAIRGPLPQIDIMPTGGVDLQTANAFLDAGAVALGVGGALVDQKLVERGELDKIKERAAQFAQLIANR